MNWPTDALSMARTDSCRSHITIGMQGKRQASFGSLSERGLRRGEKRSNKAGTIIMFFTDTTLRDMSKRNTGDVCDH